MFVREVLKFCVVQINNSFSTFNFIYNGDQRNVLLLTFFFSNLTRTLSVLYKSSLIWKFHGSIGNCIASVLCFLAASAWYLLSVRSYVASM